MSSQRRSCDACRRRKTRCEGRPCKRCIDASLLCTNNMVRLKKGPKEARSNIISQIRKEQEQDVTRLIIPIPRASEIARERAVVNPSELLPLESTKYYVDSFCKTESNMLFMLDREQILYHLEKVDESLTSYCLVGSVCAFMATRSGAAHDFAYSLMRMVIRIRTQLNVEGNPAVEMIQSSILNFACAFELARDEMAWVCLREAVTFARLYKMNQQRYYDKLEAELALKYKCLYAVICIAERSFALHRYKPLTIKGDIVPPGTTMDDFSSGMAGLKFLVSMFRPIDDTFINLWIRQQSCVVDKFPVSPPDNRSTSDWLQDVQSQITRAVPPELFVDTAFEHYGMKGINSEFNKADIWYILQHWLHIVVWQLSLALGVLSSSLQLPLTHGYPLLVMHELLHRTESCHIYHAKVCSVSLVEKLFTIATVGIDVYSSYIQLGSSRAYNAFESGESTSGLGTGAGWKSSLLGELARLLDLMRDLGCHSTRFHMAIQTQIVEFLAEQGGIIRQTS